MDFIELLSSTADRDYMEAKNRNDDLTTLAEGVAMMFKRCGENQQSATVLKEAIVCAYLLGRRDAVDVPRVFYQ